MVDKTESAERNGSDRSVTRHHVCIQRNVFRNTVKEKTMRDSVCRPTEERPAEFGELRYDNAYR